MASKKNTLRIVITKFPESCQEITELFHHSDFFRSICEDYVDCLQVLERLSATHRMINKGYIKEYKALLQELEKELLVRLKKD